MKQIDTISSTIGRSSTVTTITSLTYIALIIAAIIFPPDPRVISLCIAATALCLHYAPWRLEVTEKELIIKRTFIPKRIPLKSITTIRLCAVEPREIRIAGDGGLFGYMGWYRNTELGTYFRYMGSTKNTFYIELANRRRYMLSCDNPEEIVSTVKNRQELSKHILKHT